MAVSTGCGSYGIFWDIENCPIPSTERASNVVLIIKQFIANKYEEKIGQKPEPCDFCCACDTRKLDANHVEALNRCGVDILHVNPIRQSSQIQFKVNADSKLMEKIQKFTEHHSDVKQNLIFVITGDIDFAPAIRTARRNRFEVILLYGSNASPEIKNSANESHSYLDIVNNRDKYVVNSTASLFTNIQIPITSNSRTNTLTNTTTHRQPTDTPNVGHQSSQSSNQRLPPLSADILQTGRQIVSNPNETGNRSQSTSRSNDNVEYDRDKLKIILEVTNVERHIAIRILNICDGDVEKAINTLLSLND